MKSLIKIGNIQSNFDITPYQLPSNRLDFDVVCEYLDAWVSIVRCKNIDYHEDEEKYSFLWFLDTYEHYIQVKSTPKLLIETGDVFYLNTTKKHRLINTSNKVATILVFDFRKKIEDCKVLDLINAYNNQN